MENSDHWPVSHRLFNQSNPCCEKQRPEIKQGNETCRHGSNTKVNPQQRSIECLFVGVDCVKGWRSRCRRLRQTHQTTEAIRSICVWVLHISLCRGLLTTTSLSTVSIGWDSQTTLQFVLSGLCGGVLSLRCNHCCSSRVWHIDNAFPTIVKP